MKDKQCTNMNSHTKAPPQKKKKWKGKCEFISPICSFVSQDCCCFLNCGFLTIATLFSQCFVFTSHNWDFVFHSFFTHFPLSHLQLHFTLLLHCSIIIITLIDDFLTIVTLFLIVVNFIQVKLFLTIATLFLIIVTFFPIAHLFLTIATSCYIVSHNCDLFSQLQLFCTLATLRLCIALLFLIVVTFSS